MLIIQKFTPIDLKFLKITFTLKGTFIVSYKHSFTKHKPQIPQKETNKKNPIIVIVM